MEKKGNMTGKEREERGRVEKEVNEPRNEVLGTGLVNGAQDFRHREQ